MYEIDEIYHGSCRELLPFIKSIITYLDVDVNIFRDFCFLGFGFFRLAAQREDYPRQRQQRPDKRKYYPNELVRKKIRKYQRASHQRHTYHKENKPELITDVHLIIPVHIRLLSHSPSHVIYRQDPSKELMPGYAWPGRTVRPLSSHSVLPLNDL